MSFPQSSRLWIVSKKDLKNVVLRETLLRKLEPTRDRNYAHRLVGNILARYIVLCNNLSEIYDQTLQTQKRIVIEKILMSSTQRLLELQKEMQKIEMSEFVYLDDALVELKLTPHNVEFLCPFYFPRQRSFEIQQMIDGIPKVVQIEEPKGLDRFKIVLTPEEMKEKQQRETIANAVNLIKDNEKARQARVAFLNAKLFPKQFRPKPRELPSVDYEFSHKSDQIPIHKIKRTKFQSDFYLPKINVAKFTFYEPPKFRLNRLGQKVLIERKKSEINEQAIGVLLDDEDDQQLEQSEEGAKLHAEFELQVKIKLDAAAQVIQRSFRRYRLRKVFKLRKMKRLELCGLLYKPDDRERLKQREIEEKQRHKRRERKREFDERLLAAIEDEKARIVKFRSRRIMIDISEDIRQWFREFYDGAKDFHRYPEDFEGGTIMVLRGETKTPEEFLNEKNKTPDQKTKEKEQKKKQKKQAKELKKKNALKEKKAEEVRRKLEAKQGPTWEFREKRYESKHFDALESTFRDFTNDWQFIDEAANRTEAPIWDWVTIDAYADVHKELRLVVDDFMRIELELLRFALAVDNKTRYIPSKRKKPKKERKRKRKKPEDDEEEEGEEGRSLEECYEELKSLQIIRKIPRRSMSEFIGDQSYAAHEMRMMNKDPVTCYGDVKSILRALVLGMGPLELPKVKSLCIAGPPRCGKKLLVEALCTELNAVLFDLSPVKVAPIVDMVKFLKDVMMVAKAVQPSVIFIDGAHKPFIRKIADDEIHENPRKLGRFLLKFVSKKLTKEDAVLLLGTTNQPLNCNFGQLRTCFEKFVMFPPTLDYGTALMTWNKGLQLKRIYDFNASAIAQVTRNYTIGDILDLIDKHVCLKRQVKLKLRPLTSEELLEDLITGPNAKAKLDEKAIASYNQFRAMIDSFAIERRKTMARIQIELDKEKEIEAKRQEKLNKEKAKAGK